MSLTKRLYLLLHTTTLIILVFGLLVQESFSFNLVSLPQNAGSKNFSIQKRLNKILVATANTHIRFRHSMTTRRSLSNSDENNNKNDDDGITATKAKSLKDDLIQKITEFRELKIRDGDVSIDFGVKGGELNSTSRAPQKVDFYGISKDVGDKASEIISVCEELENSPVVLSATM